MSGRVLCPQQTLNYQYLLIDEYCFLLFFLFWNLPLWLKLTLSLHHLSKCSETAEWGDFAYNAHQRTGVLVAGGIASSTLRDWVVICSVTPRSKHCLVYKRKSVLFWPSVNCNVVYRLLFLKALILTVVCQLLWFRFEILYSVKFIYFIYLSNNPTIHSLIYSRVRSYRN